MTIIAQDIIQHSFAKLPVSQHKQVVVVVIISGHPEFELEMCSYWITVTDVTLYSCSFEEY